MTTLEATFETVTPLFLGGARSSGSDERHTLATSLRPPSLKGVLRFWWRAIYWSHYVREAGGDVAEAMRLIHRAGGELWGTASDDGGGRQSRVLLSVDSYSPRAVDQPPVRESIRLRQGGRYLAGQGLAPPRVEPMALQCDFRLRLRFHRDTTERQVQQVRKTLRVFGMLGGLGARSRRGFGSIRLRDGLQPIPIRTLALQQILKEELGELVNLSPPYSAFWQGCRVDLSLSQNSALAALESVGESFQKYRQDCFADDTNLVAGFLVHVPPHRLPRRASFGLPHNYYFRNRRQTVSIEPKLNDRKRRASPLWIHIHRLPGDAYSYVALQCYMPSTFMPRGDGIEMSSEGQRRELDWSFDPDVIPGYLDQFPDRERIL